MPASENVAPDAADETPKPWQPPLFPKQKEALEACFRKRVGLPNLVLFSGPRFSGKTVCAVFALILHAWETDRGNVLVLTITQSVGTDSGVWQDIISITQDWINVGFGMKWIREPYLDSGTKKPAFIINNKHGNQTKVQLDSLKNEDEAEGRYKGKRYSMVFINELTKFMKRKVFDTLKQALRMMHLKEEDHLFLSDCNPSLELGRAHFAYKIWYELRSMSDDDIQEECAKTDTDDDSFKLPPKALMPLRNSLRLVEFTIDDNLSVSTEKKEGLMADFGHDPDVLASYFYGKWTNASVDALFYKVFRPKFHIRGNIPNASDPDPEILVPEENCFELQTGNDPGGVNCASVFGEKIIQRRKEIKDGKEIIKEVPVFKLLDELVIIGEDFHLEDFVEKMVEKMLFWEKIIGRPGKIRWTHWSDSNVFSNRIPFSDKYFHQHIFEASAGMIALIAAEKGRGSVGAGVDLVRKLLFEERLFVSARCVKSIEMFRSIRKGPNPVAVIQKGSPFKHVLDAIRYWLQSECYDEMNRSTILTLKRTRGDSAVSGLIQVAV